MLSPPIARYERLSLLGKGSTSSVYRARRRSDGNIFAYKVVRLEGFSEGTTERRALRRLLARGCGR